MPQSFRRQMIQPAIQSNNIIHNERREVRDQFLRGKRRDKKMPSPGQMSQLQPGVYPQHAKQFFKGGDRVI